VTLVFTQFMTLGLLALSSGGGALLGYAVRARQNRLAARAGAGGDGARPPVERAHSGVLLPPVEDGRRNGSW
jgi:hypothetical protein